MTDTLFPFHKCLPILLMIPASGYFFPFQRVKFRLTRDVILYNKKMKKYLFVVTGLFLFALAQGCGTNCSVTGKVTFPDGTPLDRGTVMFESEKLVARGSIQKDGTYSLITGEKKGIPKGTYQVCIGGLSVPTITATPAADGKGPSKVTVTKVVSPIDTKYSSGAKSGLTCEVKGRTKYDIKVEPPK